MSVLSNLRRSWNHFFAEKTPRSYGVLAGIVLLIALLLEVFVFNYKWVVSAFDRPLDVQLQVEGGITAPDGSVTFTEDTAVIRIDDINEKVKFLHFCPGSLLGSRADITVAATDEANANPLTAPTRTVLTAVKQSQYIRLHFSGQVKNMTITVSGLNGVTIAPEDLTLNGKAPLMFSAGRFLIVALGLMLLYILRPGSECYRYRTDLSVPAQKGIVVGLFVLEALLLWGMIQWNTTNIELYKFAGYQQQYYKLVDAFREGHLYLDQEVPRGLSEMDNPYDFAARYYNDVSSADYWDHSYFNGRFYVYFGVVPALLLYLPYNLVTGGDLPNYIAVYVLALLLMAGVFYLLWQMIKKWFAHTPFLLYLLLAAVFPPVAAIGYAINKPDLYIVPILSGVMFAVWGLAFWLSAEEKKDGETRLVSHRLAAGSLCVALTAGCRPQLLLAIGLGVILFWNSAFGQRKLFSKNSIRQTTAVCLPFFIVALGIMWYNFARFGSPFDFGASYNLTTNDMTHRGFVAGRIGLGLFSYLFQPVSVNGVFPFLHDFDASTVYQGLTLTEKMIGGVFWLFPVLLFGLYGVCRGRLFKEKRVHRMAVYSVLAAVVIVVADTQMAGLLTRYFVDFVWLLLLAAVMTVLALYENKKDMAAERKKVLAVSVTLGLVSLVFVFLRIFAHTEDAIQAANPQVFYTIQHLIAFWM